MAFWEVDLDGMVKDKHELWKINEVIRFESMMYRFKDLDLGVGRDGYGVDKGIKCLYLQFHYDLSDRELEGRLRFDMAFRWFCGFTAFEETPDHSFFCRFRKLMGTKRIGILFKAIQARAEKENLIGHTFRFVDSTAIISKGATWEERDKAKKKGDDDLNNQNIGKYGSDKDARMGCKGKKKYWYGYKAHVSADMRSGLICNIAATPANVSDGKGFKHICPKHGEIVFGDKAYGLGSALKEMMRRGAQSAAILKNNMKEKNRDLDRWRSSLRAPFEGIFSKFEKRARYRGLAKIQLQSFMNAIVFNVKRMVALTTASPPLSAGEA